MVSEVLFSSRSEEWGTPQTLFDQLDKEFHFDLDVCATPENAKCKKFFTKEDDGLAQEWHGMVWCNPPYGKEIIKWVEACTSYEGSSVMLVPARTDTRWFHNYVYKNPRVELRFIKGRLHFNDSKDAAPFPSMLVIIKEKGK